MARYTRLQRIAAVARPASANVAACLLCFLLAACFPAAEARPAADPRPAAQDAPQPTLADFWEGRAVFRLDQVDTGLPMGESDTVLLPHGEVRAYLHAGMQSLGVVDPCGDPVPFPGCVVTFAAIDGGRTFTPSQDTSGAVVCLLDCMSCPCTSRRDHIDQQQYPRVAPPIRQVNGLLSPWVMAYEYRGSVFIAYSGDGLQWTRPAQLPQTGVWKSWLMPCRPEETVGAHPHAPHEFDCLVGSPPGVFVDAATDDTQAYIFVGLGQNPGAMGCYHGPVGSPPALWRKCEHNPLFVGSVSYGPPDAGGPAANAYFDFRTVSSVEVIRQGDQLYMLYEGVRGPQAGDAGDTQFALGLARAQTPAVDGPWETFSDNPILVDLPGNVGVGHADLLVQEGVTWLYTSLDGKVRSRLRLAWK